MFLVWGIGIRIQSFGVEYFGLEVKQKWSGNKILTAILWGAWAIITYADSNLYICCRPGNFLSCCYTESHNFSSDHLIHHGNRHQISETPLFDNQRLLYCLMVQSIEFYNLPTFSGDKLCCPQKSIVIFLISKGDCIDLEKQRREAATI